MPAWQAKPARLAFLYSSVECFARVISPYSIRSASLLALVLAALILPAACIRGNDAPSKTALAEQAGATARFMAKAASPGENPYRGYHSRNYDEARHWLCHPGQPLADNVCRSDTRATAVEANGTLKPLDTDFERTSAVACFYVYPTASMEMSANADFTPDDETVAITKIQAALYQRACDVYAPVYRQSTLSLMALDMVPGVKRMTSPAKQDAYAMAYADVVDAFMQFVGENDGRGFILIGHSQGSELLMRLIRDVIEPDAYLSRHFVAAHIPGANIAVARVPAQADTSFRHTPACRTANDIHCVVGYSSFSRDDPALGDAPKYGVTEAANTQALCVNPAELVNGGTRLDARLPTGYPPVFRLILKPTDANAGPFRDRARNEAIDTPFYALPGRVHGRCVERGGAHYLAVSIDSPESDALIDKLPGAFFGNTGWGLHLIDINVAQGDLVRLATLQAKAWAASSAGESESR